MPVHKETPPSVLSPFLLLFLPSFPLSFLSFSPAPVLPELMKFLFTPAVCVSGWDGGGKLLVLWCGPTEWERESVVGFGCPQIHFQHQDIWKPERKKDWGVAGEAER